MKRQKPKATKVPSKSSRATAKPKKSPKPVSRTKASATKSGKTALTTAHTAEAALEGQWIFDQVKDDSSAPHQLPRTPDRWTFGRKGRVTVATVELSNKKLIVSKGTFSIDGDTVRARVAYKGDFSLKIRGATLEYSIPDEEHGGSSTYIARRVGSGDRSMEDVAKDARKELEAERAIALSKAPKPGGTLVRFVSSPGPADATGPLRASAGRAAFPIRAVLLDCTSTYWQIAILDEAPAEPLGYPDDPSSLNLSMLRFTFEPGFVCRKEASKPMDAKVAYSGARYRSQKGDFQFIHNGQGTELSWYFELTSIDVIPWSGKRCVVGTANGRIYLGFRRSGASAAVAGEFTATVRFKADPASR